MAFATAGAESARLAILLRRELKRRREARGLMSDKPIRMHRGDSLLDHLRRHARCLR
jgi:hypothetical protein